MVEVQKSIEGAKKFYLSWSLHDYDVRNEGIAIGEKRGERQGEARGREEKARETARNMLVRNYPVADIVEITGLSLAEVEELGAEAGKTAF